MSVLGHLHPLQFNELPNINDITEITSEDEACLADIKAVLEKHNRTSKFGIALLHSHFMLKDDEVLIEYCDSQKRLLISKPVKYSSSLEKQAIETLWRFDSSTSNNTKKWCEKYCPRGQDNKHYGYKDHLPGES